MNTRDHGTTVKRNWKPEMYTQQILTQKQCRYFYKRLQQAMSCI